MGLVDKIEFTIFPLPQSKNNRLWGETKTTTRLGILYLKKLEIPQEHKATDDTVELVGAHKTAQVSRALHSTTHLRQHPSLRFLAPAVNTRGRVSDWRETPGNRQRGANRLPKAEQVGICSTHLSA